MRPLFKTTIVIWSEYNPNDPLMTESEELEAFVRDGVLGNAYIPKVETVRVVTPEEDPDWDGTEFFGPVDDFEEVEDGKS